MAVEHEMKVRVDDTLEMVYYIDDCTDPWKTPETIVMLPGCRKPRQVFYAWIPTLAREYRVIRPHYRGHWGSTPAPKDYPWTTESMVLDVKNFLDAMGLDKVHLIGESLGGFLSYHIAYHYPERLKTMTLATAPGPSFKDNQVGKWGSLQARHPVWGKDEKSRAQLVSEAGPENRDLAEWGYTERWKNDQEASNGYFKACATCGVNEDEFLPKIRVPTLYMMGEECTRIISVQEAQRICTLIPKAKLVTFPGVKAQCQFTLPEKCAQEALQFIKENS